MPDIDIVGEIELAFQNVFSPHIRLRSPKKRNRYEPSSPRRMNAVRQRARDIQEEEGVPYHIAMRRAGGEMAKAARDGTR